MSKNAFCDLVKVQTLGGVWGLSQVELSQVNLKELRKAQLRISPLDKMLQNSTA